MKHLQTFINSSGIWPFTCSCYTAHHW